MGDMFTTFDLVVFFSTIIGVMAVGMIAGRKEETSEDYFLAGRSLPWWGVAASTFGSNVSAEHMAGMMGVGFSIGFYQSHFELGAIAGLMVLCYGFLPVYRKLRVYTLSEYLGKRYDHRSQFSYAIIMLILMIFVQMVPGLYIGARTICVLIGDQALMEDVYDEAGHAKTTPDAAAATSTTDRQAQADAPAKRVIKVRPAYYASFVIAIAAVAASYTIVGGLKAVVWTDAIQSSMILVAGILVALLTFSKIGGWGAMLELDRLADVADGSGKMHLYLPMNHPDLPWTGVFTGLMAMHFYYWGTNQFIVQRSLGARSDAEARRGIVAAGYLKLLIPFFSISTGVAASYLLKDELAHRTIHSDTVFPEIVRHVVPVGVGLIGLIMAGLIGAIMSAIDSMSNSAATIATVDIYSRYFNPRATDRQKILFGRLSIVVFVTLAALMAIFALNPNSDKNFFLQIVDYQGYFIPGILVAFFLGMFWKRGTPAAGLAAVVSGVVFSVLVEFVYSHHLRDVPAIREMFGERLNAFHRVVVVIALTSAVYAVVSFLGRPDAEKSRLTWSDLGGHGERGASKMFAGLAVAVAGLCLLGGAMYSGWIQPRVAAWIAAGWVLLMFARPISLAMAAPSDERGLTESGVGRFLRQDRVWAALLCAIAAFMLFAFY